MIIDISLLVILVLSVYCGARKGLISTVCSSLGWIGGLIFSLIFADQFKEKFLVDSSAAHGIQYFIYSKLSSDTDDANSVDNIPTNLKDVFAETKNNLAIETTNQITDIVLGIIAFLVMVVIFKLVMFLIYELFSRERNDNVIGFFDSLAGAGLGIIRGIILIYLVLMIFIPLIQTMVPETAEFFVDNLKESMVSGYLYDNNLFVILIKSVAPEMLL